MSPRPSPPEPASHATQRDEDAQYYRQILHELIEIGADLARAVHRQATPEPNAQPNAEPSTARRLAARKRIIREVEDTIQRRTEGPEAQAQAESLNAELAERLDAPDLDDDLDQLPIADIIASICRDLGIAHHLGTHPWKRRTPRDVRDLCARAAHPRMAQPRMAQPSTGDPRPHFAPPQRTQTGTGPPAP